MFCELQKFNISSISVRPWFKLDTCYCCSSPSVTFSFSLSLSLAMDSSRNVRPRTETQLPLAGPAWPAAAELRATQPASAEPASAGDWMSSPGVLQEFRDEPPWTAAMSDTASPASAATAPAASAASAGDFSSLLGPQVQQESSRAAPGDLSSLIQDALGMLSAAAREEDAASVAADAANDTNDADAASAGTPPNAEAANDTPAFREFLMTRNLSFREEQQMRRQLAEAGGHTSIALATATTNLSTQMVDFTHAIEHSMVGLSQLVDGNLSAGAAADIPQPAAAEQPTQPAAAGVDVFSQLNRHLNHQFDVLPEPAMIERFERLGFPERIGFARENCVRRTYLDTMCYIIPHELFLPEPPAGFSRVPHLEPYSPIRLQPGTHSADSPMYGNTSTESSPTRPAAAGRAAGTPPHERSPTLERGASFVCNWGRHRSLAVARLLSETLSEAAAQDPDLHAEAADDMDSETDAADERDDGMGN